MGLPHNMFIGKPFLSELRLGHRLGHFETYFRPFLCISCLALVQDPRSLTYCWNWKGGFEKFSFKASNASFITPPSSMSPRTSNRDSELPFPLLLNLSTYLAKFAYDPCHSLHLSPILILISATFGNFSYQWQFSLSQLPLLPPPPYFNLSVASA